MKIKGSQKGSSILVVIMVISVIGIISAASMRSALTSREQANLSLVDQVINNESSVALFDLTSYNINSGVNANLHTLANSNPDKEIVYCVGDKTAVSIMQWPGTVATPNNSAIGGNGYCKTSYMSRNKGERKVTLTQVALRRDKTTLPSIVSGDKVLTGRVFVATVTTLMPGKSSATYASIDACLNTRVNNMTMVNHNLGTDVVRKPVVECLRDLGVPAVSLTHTYIN